MLNELGQEFETMFSDIKFIGVQEGGIKDYLMFNCEITGATFCGNSLTEIQRRINEVRKNIK